METKKQPGASQTNAITIFFDGAGCRPDGEGSGYAWFCPDSNDRLVKRVPHLTNNQAEYQGFIAALQYVREDAVVEICTDSELIYAQFLGIYRAKDPALQALLSEVHTLVLNKRLKVTLKWLPRGQNLAGKLL